MKVTGTHSKLDATHPMMSSLVEASEGEAQDLELDIPNGKNLSDSTYYSTTMHPPAPTLLPMIDESQQTSDNFG